MPVVGRLLGLVLLVVAAIALLRDVIACYDTGILQFLSGLQLWFVLAPDLYASVERFGSENLSVVWSPIATSILALPAFVSAGLLGLAVIVLSRRRKQTPSGGGNPPNLRRVYG